jgi:hypothetical protein
MYCISKITGTDGASDRYELIDDDNESRVNPFEFLTEDADAFESFLDIWTEPINANIERVTVDRRTLARMYASFLQERNRKGHTRDRHVRDIALIGERMMDEARRRGWCVEYDQIVASLNEHLSVELPERPRRFTLTIAIEVNASSEDEARDMGRELINGMSADGHIAAVEDHARS